jgi:hypothetical protein
VLLAPALAPPTLGGQVATLSGDAAMFYPNAFAQCRDGVATACLRMTKAVQELADKATSYVPPAKVKDNQSAYYVMACYLGDDRGCTGAMDTLPVNADLTKTHVLEKQCALASGATSTVACVRSAARYLGALTYGETDTWEHVTKPDEHPRDEPRGRGLAAEACERGDADGCWLASASDS